MTQTALASEDRLPQVVRREGRIATLTKARKLHRCAVCPEYIPKGDYYYSVVVGGGGLGSLKFPTRVHTYCLEKHFDHIRRSQGF